jgi:hypothetical protein
VVPETILTVVADGPSASFNSASTAALALPRSGAAATLIFKVSPSHPAITLREDPAMTLMESFTKASLNGELETGPGLL